MLNTKVLYANYGASAKKRKKLLKTNSYTEEQARIEWEQANSIYKRVMAEVEPDEGQIEFCYRWFNVLRIYYPELDNPVQMEAL